MNPIRCNVATLVCMIFASLFLFGYVILCSGIAILVSVHFYIHCICPTSLTFRARYFNEDELQRRAIHIVADIVNSHNETRCRNNFRVDRTRFLRLCEILQNDIEETPSMPISVQVAIYLHWIANAATLRQQRETFKLSHDRLELARRNVRRAIMTRMYPQFVRPVTNWDVRHWDAIPPIHPKRFRPSFHQIPTSL